MKVNCKNAMSVMNMNVKNGSVKNMKFKNKCVKNRRVKNMNIKNGCVNDRAQSQVILLDHQNLCHKSNHTQVVCLDQLNLPSVLPCHSNLPSP